MVHNLYANFLTRHAKDPLKPQMFRREKAQFSSYIESQKIAIVLIEANYMWPPGMDNTDKSESIK